jgi:hypothetical protein
MAKLEYTFKNDTLFKMLFARRPDWLKRLGAKRPLISASLNLAVRITGRNLREHAQ